MGLRAMAKRTRRLASQSREMRKLKARIDELEEQLLETLASMELTVVDGYFVKLWKDVELDVWAAACPTVRTVAQESTREEVVAAMARSIEGMLRTLKEMGHKPPKKDVDTGGR